MRLAYARVSAKDQNPERQLVKFRELGVEERYIFVSIVCENVTVTVL